MIELAGDSVGGFGAGLDTGTVYPYVSREVGYQPGAGYYLVSTGELISTDEAARLAGGVMYGNPGDGVDPIYPGGGSGLFDEGGQVGEIIYTAAGAHAAANPGIGLMPILLIGLALFAARHS